MTTTSRRSFLKLGLAATAGGVGLAQAKPVFEPASFDKETDVVIIGTGAAGSSAAARCSQLGLKVIVLEKMPVGGGSSVLCNGGFAVCCTDVQERKRIKDSPELFEKELLTMGKVNDPELVHTFVTASLPTYKWMRGLGVEVNDVTTGAGMSVPRQHMTRPPQMLGIFREITEKAGGQYLFKTAARRLIVNEEGRVTGVEAESRGKKLSIRARRGVVIAAGGWARSEDLLRRFSPAAEKALKLGGIGNSGDGSKMAWALGADLLDVSYTKATYGFNPKTKTSAFVMYNGAMMVNLNGERYADESRPYKELGDMTLAQPEGIGVQIYDAAIPEEAQKDPLARTDTLKKNGELYSADTIEGLAKAMGLPADKLAATVRAYNEGLAKGADAFGRTSLSAGNGKPAPIVKAPFYGFRATAVLLSTYCGPKIDSQARVINIFGEPIEGLWAAGEGTGGLHGAAYMSGTSVGKAVVFGKIAAESIAGKQ